MSRHGTRKPDGNCVIDYGFHMIVGGVDDDSLTAMDRLVGQEGISSVKLFMAYPGVFLSDDGRDPPGHAEGRGERLDDHDARRKWHRDRYALIAQSLARGNVDPLYHGLNAVQLRSRRRPTGRSSSVEVAGCPLYVVHMSAVRRSSR